MCMAEGYTCIAAVPMGMFETGSVAADPAVISTPYHEMLQMLGTLSILR